MLKSLRNDSARMEIGYRWVSNKCMLFIRTGTFPDEDRAKNIG